MPAGVRVVFGTAGHVDHGKSSLVLTLTGTDPDRWAEEKAREMTIDLGFAFLDLPDFDDPVAIVDVPGHEMFVRNMVAGATGIDAAILVIAADEGVMPQTVEHLDVLRYLQVASGVVALTKVDKATPERVEEVRTQVRKLLHGTRLADIACVPVSARTGVGLDAFREALREVAANVTSRNADGIFRLPIDRVFTLKGAGTVITGTVLSGSLAVGDSVDALPLGRVLRARNLQVHDQSADRVYAGQRAAVNLPDVAKDELHRGDVLATPGAMAPTLMMDTRISLSPTASKALRQRSRVRIHHASKEVMTRAVLLEADDLKPGEEAVVQLRLEAPLVALAGDVFVMRSYSPMRVIGGGSVIDPHPPKRTRRTGASDVLVRESLPAEEVLVDFLDRAGSRGAGADDLRVAAGLSDSSLHSALDTLREAGKVIQGRRGRWFGAGAIEEMQAGVVKELARLHSENPLRMSVNLSDLASRASTERGPSDCFRLAVEALHRTGKAILKGESVRLAGHEPQWTGPHAAARRRILDACRKAGLSTPSVREMAELTGLSEDELKRLLDALVDAGELGTIAPTLYVLKDVIDRCRRQVCEYLEQHGRMTIGDARELLGASRKYLLPFLEMLDQEGVTVRRGDYRELRRRGQSR